MKVSNEVFQDVVWGEVEVDEGFENWFIVGDREESCYCSEFKLSGSS
jgi:hypothetical protein